MAQRGGYFIDLNSGNPTASSPYNALDNTAGLCTLCHGGSVAGDVDKMNFYAASLWRADQVNGHSNAVQGGTGSNKRDLFNANRGTQPYMASQNGVLVYRFGQNINTLPWRNLLNGGKPCDTTSTLETTTCPPRNTGWYGGTAESVVKNATGYRDWYHQTGFVTPTKPHNFPCSKCHSPHAATAIEEAEALLRRASGVSKTSFRNCTS